MDFPTLVYKDKGPHQREGGTFSYAPAKDNDELQSLLKAGWFKTLVEALGIDESPVKREELEQKADQLGIKYDGRTTDKKLLSLIDEAIK